VTCVRDFEHMGSSCQQEMACSNNANVLHILEILKPKSARKGVALEADSLARHNMRHSRAPKCSLMYVIHAKSPDAAPVKSTPVASLGMTVVMATNVPYRV
jgi:hypothetical protein